VEDRRVGLLQKFLHVLPALEGGIKHDHKDHIIVAVPAEGKSGSLQPQLISHVPVTDKKAELQQSNQMAAD
jgi:hypothetical protein